MNSPQSHEAYRTSFAQAYSDAWHGRPATEHSNDRRAVKKGYAAGREAGQRARNYFDKTYTTKGQG